MRRIDGFLFGEESGRRLAITHAALTVLVGLRVALGPYRSLAGQPRALFRPVWFLRMLPAMPSVGAIEALQAVGVTAAVIALVLQRGERRSRVAFALAWVCLLVLAGLRGSRGKILHNDVVLLLACVPFLAAGGASFRDRVRSVRHGWPIRASLVVVAGAYFFSGLSKVERSGLAWITSDNVTNVLRVASGSPRVAFPWLAQTLAGSGWLDHVVAATVLGFELSFPIVLVALWARRPYAVAAVVFHTATWFLLGIDYWLWAAAAAVVLIDWGAVGPLREAERHPDLVTADHL